MNIINGAGSGRRDFLMSAMRSIVFSQFGTIPFSLYELNKDVPAHKPPLPAFQTIKQIEAGDLDIGYADEGPASGPVVILLHGWPYDIHSYIDVVPLLTREGYRVVVPYLRGYGTTRFLSDKTFRNGQQSAIAYDIIRLMDALAIRSAIIGGFDWGARAANIIGALWPERCKAMVTVSGYLIANRSSASIPLAPEAELQWWYQFYFATDRGSEGYEKYTSEFARLIWRTASPEWKFNDAIFNRTSTAFNNPDHARIVIHNYRWRLGLAEGESRYDDFESKLAAAPVITVPAISLEGDANGAPHQASSGYAHKFSGKYKHVHLTGGIGHNLPQEAPGEFAAAILELGEWI